MDEPPRRARFIPGWLIGLVAAGIIIVIVATAAILTVTAPDDVVVPDVTGLREPEARDALQEAGLTLLNGGTRFSPETVQG
ncbi:MAG TPA: PASTA domain-containing protein, partial [Coriobacteriia bacterium]|nr:PASTA domain-containing protein [Coriobacteriia bacterium]